MRNKGPGGQLEQPNEAVPSPTIAPDMEILPMWERVDLIWDFPMERPSPLLPTALWLGLDGTGAVGSLRVEDILRSFTQPKTFTTNILLTYRSSSEKT